MEPRKDILLLGRVLRSAPFQVGDSHIVERDFPGRGYQLRVEQREQGPVRLLRSPRGDERDLDITVIPPVFEWSSKIPFISHRLITR